MIFRNVINFFASVTNLMLIGYGGYKAWIDGYGWCALIIAIVNAVDIGMKLAEKNK